MDQPCAIINNRRRLLPYTGKSQYFGAGESDLKIGGRGFIALRELIPERRIQRFNVP